METLTAQERIADLEHALGLAMASKERCQQRYLDMQKLVMAYVWQEGGTIRVGRQAIIDIPRDAELTMANDVMGDYVQLSVNSQRPAEDGE